MRSDESLDAFMPSPKPRETVHCVKFFRTSYYTHRRHILQKECIFVVKFFFFFGLLFARSLSSLSLSCTHRLKRKSHARPFLVLWLCLLPQGGSKKLHWLFPLETRVFFVVGPTHTSQAASKKREEGRRDSYIGVKRTVLRRR